MPDVATLEDHLASERSVAVRSLLRHPIIDSTAHHAEFRVVVRHREWLIAWFDDACGWALTVDVASGFARLAKRSARTDERRPLHRTRGGKGPFDRRRYQLLCLVAAELVHHPVTTIGVLARAITPEAGLDTTKHGDRSAFVDAVRALVAWGAVRSDGGELDAFVDDDRANAILQADTARLHRLLVSALPLSSVPDDATLAEAAAHLRAEPRYGDVEQRLDRADDQQRRLWARHSLTRRLLDDAAVHHDELSEGELAYLTSTTGARVLRDRLAEAGFELEERGDGVLAVDPEGISSDRTFPSGGSTVHQVALLLIDRLIEDDGARRTLRTLALAEVERAVADLLERHTGWAKGHREGDGPRLLARDAVDLLADLGLVRLEPDGAVAARPALARYRAGTPVRRGAPTLFEELSP